MRMAIIERHHFRQIRTWYLISASALTLLLISPVFQRHGPVIADGWFYFLLFANIGAFILFGLDKLASKSNDGERIPERVLLSAVSATGAVGGLVGQALFRHKISKTAFIVKNVLACVVSTLIYAFILELL